uniref:CCR4-NOT transcription complex subunit 3 n=1 Tax=Ananas comosus var. bracteatus TaxID=296719 RepID=A0A6V7QF97_ANACO|nr:unnamed protein product [Ananas comosus var. bracteatus]
MGASRKLQGEIDRVLKKVQEGVEVFDSIWNKVYDTENANQKEKFEADLKKEIKKLQRYRDQIKTWIQSSEIKDKKALMDARKLIEREMERFKVCEKETKTKAFSKEGLGQQPKTDPKEKAKSETRDWLNNVVGDLESQIDNFEAEVEGLSFKKGKTRPPRLVHLETSITRHKAHIKKLELILRLLENDELSPDQVNDIKDFLEDYVERNQEDFEEFSDVDELYSSLPLEKVEALEDLVSLGPSGLIKGIGSVSTASSVLGLKNSAASSPNQAALSSTAYQHWDTYSTVASTTARPLVGTPTVAAILSGPASVRGVSESTSAVATSSLVNPSATAKEDDNVTFPGRRSSPGIPEIGIGRGMARGISNQTNISAPMNLSTASGISGTGAIGSVPAVSDLMKRNMLNVDQPLVSPLGNRILLQQVSRTNDGTVSNDTNNVGEGSVIGGRVFSPGVASGVQWRPQSASGFQNETGQFRGRPEIAPDQRESFCSACNKCSSKITQFSTQQQSSLLQQFNSQSPSMSPQMSLGLGVQGPGLASIPSVSQQQPSPILQQSSQHTLISTGAKDGADAGHTKTEEQQGPTDDLNAETGASSGLSKVISEDDSKTQYANTSSTSVTEGNQLTRDTDISPGQPLQPSQQSGSLGVIGRRSVSDLGTIGDNISGQSGSSGGMHDNIYNMQMLESAYYKLPQPKDSERLKSYVPRHPAVTPSSFPQTQAPIVSNGAFWERLGIDPIGTDTLFFAFYYQQNTYQQYLAARELKRQSWRYHKKYNTWFQRHEEPKVTNDEYERGSYVYFDFHVSDEGSGWCQRIKTDFTFEYNYLEDELVV